MPGSHNDNDSDNDAAAHTFTREGCNSYMLYTEGRPSMWTVRLGWVR